MFASDVLWLRKNPRAGFVNAGREVLGFVAAFGPYAAVLALTGPPELSLDLLPAAAIFVCIYFFTTRALFYFTLLVRDKLEYAEKILILRWEIISYLLTLIALGGRGRGAAALCACRLARRGAGAGRDRRC